MSIDDEIASLTKQRNEIARRMSYYQLQQYKPYPKQLEFHSAGADPGVRERLLVAGNQLGKFHPVTEPVLTPTGWVAIGDLKIGDRVIAGDGTVTEVTGVFPQGVQPLIELEFCYGQKVIAGHDHLWYVQTPDTRFRTRTKTVYTEHGDNPDKVIRGRRKHKGSESAPNPRYGEWEIWTTAQMRAKHGDNPTPVNRFATPAVGTVEFDAKPTPVDPYILGALLGDGGLTNGSVTISSVDEEILDAFRAEAKARGGELKHANRCTYRMAYCPTLKADLVALGVMGHGSATKRVPECYLWNTPAVRLAVLQGLMDTDGTCEESGNMSFTSISEGLAKDVEFLARSFGGKVWIKSRVTSYTYRGEKKQGKRSYTVVIRLPHVPIFRLKRKLDRVVRPVSTSDHNLIVAFRDVEPAESVCISVAHPSKLYVTRDFIVTHNTLSASRETAMHLTGQYPKWWPGVVFLKPTTGWAASITSQGTRDSVQRMLLGQPGNWGTGAIPKSAIVDIKKSTHGVSDAVESITVHHIPPVDNPHGLTDGTSRLTLKTYDQGRERWQGDTLNFCIAEGQGVQLADGRYLPIERVTTGMVVRTADGRGRPVSRTVAAVHDRGVRPIVEVAMSRGPWLRMTPDHEVYEGVNRKARADTAKKIFQLAGDWEPTGAVEAKSDAHFAWAGLVVAEGSTSCRKVTMGECPAIQSAIVMLPPDARVRRHDFAERHKHVPDWFLYWDEFWADIPSGHAHEKSVPDWVFTAPNRQIAVFLSYLYAGDGWASGHTVGYGTTSRTLAEQVSVLLHRFGIRSTVTRVPPKSANWREQWHVHICSCRAVSVFGHKIGIIGKEAALARVTAEADRRKESKSVRASHLKTGGESRLKTFFREQNARVADRYGKINGVTPAGECRVYDLSIETDHKFVVGTSVVSNCWFDEEPDEDIYFEGLTRTNATGGIVYMTFTPLLGMSNVVRRFLIEKPAGTHVTTMTIYDALHFTDEVRAQIIASYKPHERDARTKGVPTMGSGRVFPFEDDLVMETPMQIPAFWPRIAGLDFGYDHPTACVWLAWDRDSDVVHIYDAYKRREATPVVHAAAIRARGAWIPVAWPHDGLQHDKGSGIILAQQYRDLGVNTLKDRATHAPAKGQKEGDGGNGLEAGLSEMFDRMQTGRLKVAKHLGDWFEEFRLYHRKDGKIVAEGDDLMSATRYALMMLRRAEVQKKPREIIVPGFRSSVPGMGCLG